MILTPKHLKIARSFCLVMAAIWAILGVVETVSAAGGKDYSYFIYSLSLLAVAFLLGLGRPRSPR
jgi:hypothetical protein